MRIFLVIASAILLGGCATYDPIPDGYTGPTAVIKDTYSNKTGTSAHYFEVEKINGNLIRGSFGATRQRNYGLGTYFEPVMVEREVLPEQQTLTISAFVFYPTDGQLLFADTLSVEGEVTLAPRGGETYFVRGSISEALSEVWLEDSSGRVVSEKFREVHDR